MTSTSLSVAMATLVVLAGCAPPTPEQQFLDDASAAGS